MPNSSDLLIDLEDKKNFATKTYSKFWKWQEENFTDLFFKTIPELKIHKSDIYLQIFFYNDVYINICTIYPTEFTGIKPLLDKYNIRTFFEYNNSNVVILFSDFIDLAIQKEKNNISKRVSDLYKYADEYIDEEDDIYGCECKNISMAELTEVFHKTLEEILGDKK